MVVARECVLIETVKEFGGFFLHSKVRLFNFVQRVSWFLCVGRRFTTLLRGGKGDDDQDRGMSVRSNTAFIRYFCSPDRQQ